MSAALKARALRKSYGAQEVVSGLDLEVAPGECFGLLGPNGAGKTTTLRLCLGLSLPDGGEIEVLGEPVPARATSGHRLRMRSGPPAGHQAWGLQGPIMVTSPIAARTSASRTTRR